MADNSEKKPRIRKRSEILERVKKQWEENPIVEKLEDTPIPGITNIEHIKELQEILVQTCIDYINKNKLTDIYSVSFSADDLNASAGHGSWQACTDSHIKVKGLREERYRRKDGTVFEMPYTYDIGE